MMMNKYVFYEVCVWVCGSIGNLDHGKWFLCTTRGKFVGGSLERQEVMKFDSKNLILVSK